MSATSRLVLASTNEGKLQELRQLLGECLEGVPQGASQAFDVDRDVVDMRSLGLLAVPESGTSFAENAIMKARAVWKATGVVSLADDSGLEVSVLGGAPGIFSARWSGRHGDDEANRGLLLAQLADIGPEHRQARYVCAAALVGWDIQVVEHGYLPGRLLQEPRGTGGFGYDPVLQPEGSELSCAQLSPVHKNAISHRSQALAALLPHVVCALGMS